MICPSCALISANTANGFGNQHGKSKLSWQETSFDQQQRVSGDFDLATNKVPAGEIVWPQDVMLTTSRLGIFANSFGIDAEQEVTGDPPLAKFHQVDEILADALRRRRAGERGSLVMLRLEEPLRLYPEPFLKWLVRRHGFTYTLEALLLIVAGDDHPDQIRTSDNYVAYRAIAFLDHILRLRNWLAAANQTDYEEATEFVERNWDSWEDCFKYLAVIALPNTDLARRIDPASLTMEIREFRHASWLVPSAADVAQAVEFAKTIQFVPEPAIMLAVLDRFGLAATKVFKEWLEIDSVDWTVLEHIRSPEAFALYPELGPLAIDYHHFLTQYPSYLDTALGIVDASGRKFLETMAAIGPPEPTETAPVEALPEFLVNPPWGTKRAVFLIKAKKPARWWSPNVFPRLIEETTGLPLSDDAMNNVERALAHSTLTQPFSGIEALRRTCTSNSLEIFALAVFDIWKALGYPPAQFWVLYALGWFGTDQTVRFLTPLIREWPGDGASKRAKIGLDVLRTIGSDLALTNVYNISQKVKYKSIKTHALHIVDELAQALEMTPEQLADRLIPGFDLDSSGSMTIDYGSRSFEVRFDEMLNPVVFDSEGNVLKSLPRVKKTDGEQAPDENQKFKTLKKGVSAIAVEQLKRLETAMVEGRRWDSDEFIRCLVEHPLMVNLTRRLVWGEFHEGAVTRTFRVDEARELVDANDTLVDIQGEVGLLHPLEFASELHSWARVFADFEIIQPFGQLDRPIVENQNDLNLLFGCSTPAPQYAFGLERKGWRRSKVDEGWFSAHRRNLRGIDVEVYFEDWLHMREIPAEENVTMTQVVFGCGESLLTWDVVDPIVRSEVALELISVVRPD